MKKMAIIGASYLQMPLVLKAKEMNIETHCFAWEEGSVCREVADFFYPISILDKELILEKCKEIEIDGIISIASDAAVPTVNYVAENMGLISNSFSDTFVCTNKYEMRKRFIKNEVSCPNFILITENYTEVDLKFPVIVKPVDRSGSRGVSKVYNNADLETAVKRAQNESFSGKVIAEEYITGNEVSVETISWQGDHNILAITDKETTGEPFFVETAHHQPSQLPMHILEKIKKETLNSLNALNIKYGASHSEFKINENGDVFAIETGARMGGDFIGSDLVRLSTGFDFVKAVIEIALGEFNPPYQLYNKFSGVYFLSAETQQILNVFEANSQHEWIFEKSITSKEIKNIECSADRSGYVIYQGDRKIIL